MRKTRTRNKSVAKETFWVVVHAKDIGGVQSLSYWADWADWRDNIREARLFKTEHPAQAVAKRVTVQGTEGVSAVRLLRTYTLTVTETV